MTAEAPSIEPTDGEVLRRYRAGDARAFETLVLRHHGLVFAVAYARLQNAEAAEDLTQEVFLRAFLMQDKLRDGERFAPWVTGMARNLATDWLRRGEVRSRLLPMIPLEDEAMAAIPDRGARHPAEAAEEEQQRMLADEAIRQLPPHQRELVLLHYSEGLSRSEIARQLGVHPSTVGRQLDAAIATMRLNVETGLKKSAPTLRPRRLAAARTLAVVAATMALTPEAKAAVLTVARESAVSSAVADPVVTTTVLQWFSSKLGTLMLGGVAAMGTGKIVGVLTAVALTVGGYHYAQMSSAQPSHPLAMVAEADLAGNFELTPGKTIAFTMEPDKVYRLTFPRTIPEVRYSNASYSRNGDLTGATVMSNGMQTFNVTLINQGPAYVLLNGSPMATYCGATMFQRGAEKLDLQMWSDLRPDLAPEMTRLISGYLEGRLSTKQYREGYVKELKRLSIGPSDETFRRLYYEELLKSLEVPMSMPADLMPPAKGGKK